MIKKIITNFKRVRKIQFMKKAEEGSKKIDFFKKIDFNAIFEKQKNSFLQFINKNDDSDVNLATIIENVIKEKFQLRGGYGDLIANEETYE